ncbi:13566_t:CDS:1, partial [Dentiscutata erythropus]
REFVGVEEVEVMMTEVDTLAEISNVKETSIGIFVSNVELAINKIKSKERLFLICSENYLEELSNVLEN